jgi:hypothetical protein
MSSKSSGHLSLSRSKGDPRFVAEGPIITVLYFCKSLMGSGVHTTFQVIAQQIPRHIDSGYFLQF